MTQALVFTTSCSKHFNYPTYYVVWVWLRTWLLKESIAKLSPLGCELRYSWWKGSAKPLKEYVHVHAYKTSMCTVIQNVSTLNTQVKNYANIGYMERKFYRYFRLICGLDCSDPQRAHIRLFFNFIFYRMKTKTHFV